MLNVKSYIKKIQQQRVRQLGTQTNTHENHQRNNKNKTFIFFFSLNEKYQIYGCYSNLTKSQKVLAIFLTHATLLNGKTRTQSIQPWHIARAHFFFASFETTKNNANASDGPFFPISYLSIAQHRLRHDILYSIFERAEKK